jgi:hypothetical protein
LQWKKVRVTGPERHGNSPVSKEYVKKIKANYGFQENDVPSMGVSE